MLEVGAAGLAAERATGEQLAAMADEITGMFATLEEPQAFLRHDLGFHRAVAAGSGNPIVAAIIGTLTEIIWETGRINMSGFSLRESAETHRRIYEAIRSRSAGARPAGDERAPRARALGAGEEGDGSGGPASDQAPRTLGARASRGGAYLGSVPGTSVTGTIAAVGPRALGRREMEMERKRTSASHLTCVVAARVDGSLPRGVPRRPGNTREDHRPSLGHHQGAGPRGVRDGRRRVERHDGHLDDQRRRPVPGQLPAPRHLPGDGRGRRFQEAHPGQGAAPDQRDPRPAHRARGRGPGGGRQRHRRGRRPQHRRTRAWGSPWTRSASRSSR